MAHSGLLSDPLGLLGRLVLRAQRRRLLLNEELKPVPVPHGLLRRPRYTPRQLAEWEHVQRDLAAVAEKRFAAKFTPILEAYRSAVRREARASRFPPIKPYLVRVAKDMKPVYRAIIQGAIEDTIARRASKAPRRRARVRINNKPYRYGTIDRDGTVNLDVDAMVSDRLDLLDSSFRRADRTLRSIIREGGGWTAEGIKDLLEEFEDRLDVMSGTVKDTESWGAVNTGRMAGMIASAVDTIEWLTAQDEKVRDTHNVYGAAGPQELGFNFASLIGARYTLRWPYDEECTELCELINCRCIPL